MVERQRRILLLSDVNSVHTRKWALSLAGDGYLVGIFSLNKKKEDWFKQNPSILYLSEATNFNASEGSDIGKLKYISALSGLKKAIRQFNPDILHAHYATSYGLLGALAGFHPFIISVWGSDVFDFPKKGFLFRRLLRYNLKKADKILSTSKIMAKETSGYTDKEIIITPFGVDTDIFKPKEPPPFYKQGDIVIGTIKALEKKYGIEYLIRAFGLLKKRNPQMPLKLMIVGKGSLLNELKALAAELNIEQDVHFTGFVDPEQIPAYHNLFTVEVFPSVSDSESFGVAVIEASACGKPVVVSNVGGLAEVVENNKTGILVPPKDSEKIAGAVEKLLTDSNLRNEMGVNGRQRVEKLYEWNDCVMQMEDIYNKMAP